MKTALDYYDRGKLKESNADDYNSSSYYAKGRFICPECGEPVHIRPSKYSNFFVHYKRTNENDECDRRVDGESTESIYERMGIPLYLRTDDEKRFYIYLGFKALPENVIVKAEKNDTVLSIEKSKKYSVNRERFSVEGTSMIPIDYIPPSNQNYGFQITPVSMRSLIEKYWSSYADGFTYEGGLFTVTEHGGRKIRHGDNVATETEYYWVRRQNQLPSFIRGIQMSIVGRLILRNNTWNVFKGSFSSNIPDSEYRSLINFLRDNLRVHLIEKVPEVLPLWPPVIKDDDGYKYVESSKKIYGKVISGNEEPKAYMYRGISTIPEDLQIHNGIVEIITGNSNIVINIDRKYISGGSVFERTNNHVFKEANSVFSEFNNNILKLGGLNSKSVLICRVNGEILEIKNEEELEIPDLKNGDYVAVLGHNHIFCSIRILLDRIAVNTSINEKEILCYVNKFKNAKKVVLPHELRQQLVFFKTSDNRIKEKIRTVLDSNEIEYPFIALMEGFLNGKH